MFKQKSRPEGFSQMRTFEINNNGKQNGQQYHSNSLKTSKYSLVTFLPSTLFDQFRRYIQIYFLFSVIIENISIVALQNTICAIYPLIFIILTSVIQEAMKTIKQHNSDNEINQINCIKIVNNKHVKITWADIEVGDILYISENEMFPSDLILLSSSYESGVCYIETSVLDGQKNLKLKSAIQETQITFQQDINEIYKIQGAPLSSSLEEFEGFIHLPDGSQKALNEKVLLLRGAFLKNTKWIIGVVAYTGEDTKITRIVKTPQNKQINIEAKINKLILGILGILNLQVMLFMFSVMLCSWWFYSQSCDHPYVVSSWNHSYLKGFSFFMFYFLSNSMLPISLMVLVKLIRLDFIKLKLFAQPLTINDKLNQVEYIFSDKTGTLTSNRLTLKYCVIGDILYGQQPKQTITTQNIDNQIIDSDPHASQNSVFNFVDHQLTGIIENHPDYQQLSDQKRQYLIQSKDQTISIELKTQQQLVHEYLMVLSSVHECIAQKNKDGGINYEGPSPDEIALVDAAKNLGFKFEGQSANQLNFTILGKPKQVELLNQFEFDSARKRISVIIKDNGIYKLYIKGADFIIKQRLQQEQPFFEFIQNKLTEFSSLGLRNLLFAMKILSEQEYQEFDKQLQELASGKREQEKEKLIDFIERDLYLLGATAVEDRLQDDVPRTIQKLLKANIKVWMLTGDKLDTAENIARSCQLIQGNFTVIRFSEQDLNALRIKTLDSKANFQLCLKEGRKISIIVEGQTLNLLTGDPLLQREFVEMALDCDSVVCCRVVPRQKAEIVHLVKEQNKVTLAIGDGENDVKMLQEADIGVGLYGKEGMRAVQSSDYALKEFRFLQELLRNHRNLKNREE